MPRRPLPTPAEASAILAAKRSRPAFRPPPRAGRALIQFVRGLDQRFGQGADGLKARWREIAGETLAARTEPVKLIKGRNGQPGVLEIRVDGPAATLIQHQAPEILARVRLVLGEGAAGRLRIVQGPVRRKADAPGAPKSAGPRPRSRAPLDAAAEARLEQDLARAPEGGLKAALRKLGREVLRSEDRGR